MSKNIYKDMMEQAVPSPELIENTKNKMVMIKENAIMQNTTNIKPRFLKKRIIALSIAVLMLSLFTMVGFAYGSQIIQLLGGGRIESGKTSDGGDYVSISMHESNPAEVRDGSIYFILDGFDTDITSYCTEATYYEYEKIADNGYRHVVIVGGTPDNLGWGEFVWDENGIFIGSTVMFQDDINGEQPEWLKLAEAALKG